MDNNFNQQENPVNETSVEETSQQAVPQQSAPQQAASVYAPQPGMTQQTAPVYGAPQPGMTQQTAPMYAPQPGMPQQTAPMYAPQPGMPQQTAPVYGAPQPGMPQQTAPMYAPQPGMPAGRPVYQRLDKKLIKQCRHKSERRWYWFLVVLNVLIIVGVVIVFLWSGEENSRYFNDVVTSVSQSAEDGGSSDALESELNNMPDNLYYLVMIIFTAVAIPFIVSYAYAQYRSMSALITEKTYPEIYAIVEEYAQKLGMKRVPKIYMIQGDGVLNAFSSFIPFRQYVEIYADLLEVAYREYHDMDTIRFIIAHEMSHIYYQHATMHYYYSIMLSQLIPILGPTASRTREYSCDRLAQLLSGSDGIDAMMSLIAGKHLYKQVDKVDYVQHALTVKGFFVFWYNLLSSHPIMTKRVVALADPLRRSGKLY